MVKNVMREIRFIDSYRFMSDSLDALLKKDQCKNIGKFYSGKKLDLLLRKGVYPYDWVDSVDKFSETQLPAKESFFSKLYGEEVSDEDYSHARNVWKEFNCKTFRDYHNVYNESDVLILADVFENFRDVCMKHYGLDPGWYYTSPGLAWDAALKITKIELELLSDYDMLLMIQKGIRGGISMISNRYGTANNKYLDSAYDESKESTYIQYLDANNLYGWAISKPLPIHDFKWMTENELRSLQDPRASVSFIPKPGTSARSLQDPSASAMPSNFAEGCILEVDLDYPEHLHDELNDYPLAPERLNIEGVEELVTNLGHKKKYVLHYENLKLYERLGLKIHRGIKFQESAWLSKYIKLNTDLRAKATNTFEKDFFKLMNNSVFGKTTENIEKRVDVRLITNKKRAIKLTSKPNFKRITIFDENLIAMHMKRTKLEHKKPIYLGMCKLD